MPGDVLVAAGEQSDDKLVTSRLIQESRSTGIRTDRKKDPYLLKQPDPLEMTFELYETLPTYVKQFV